MATEYLTCKHTNAKTVYFRIVDPSNDNVWDFDDDQWEANVAACGDPKLSATEKTDFGDADESYYIASYDLSNINNTATPKQILIQAIDDLATDEIITETEGWVVAGVLLTRVDVLRIEGGDATDALQTAVANKLDAAIPGSPTADSINERLAAIDDLVQASGNGDLALLLKLAQCDYEIDTSKSPWELVINQSGTSTELLRKKLYEPDDTAVAASSQVIGKHVNTATE